MADDLDEKATVEQIPQECWKTHYGAETGGSLSSERLAVVRLDKVYIWLISSGTLMSTVLCLSS